MHYRFISRNGSPISVASHIRTSLACLALATLSPETAIARQALVTPTANEYLTIPQLRTKYAEPTGKFTTIKGVEIYYKDEGKGPVLLMVHGSQGSLRTWDVIVKRLKSHYRIIRYDVPGMGLSGRISDEAAANVVPTDIAIGLLDKLGVKKLTFVGVSSGGTLGMFLAARKPELVERLILSNTPSDRVTYGHMVQPDSFKMAQEEARQAGGFQSRRFWDEFLSYFSGVPARFTPKLRDEYYDFNRRVPEKHPIALIAQIGDGVEASKRMAAITAPTLLVWGSKDALLPVTAMKSLAGHLKQAPTSSVIMPDVGHYPPVEVPERFAKIISAYVEAVVPDPSSR